MQSTHSLLCLFDRLVIDCSQSIEVMKTVPMKSRDKAGGGPMYGLLLILVQKTQLTPLVLQVSEETSPP